MADQINNQSTGDRGVSRRAVLRTLGSGAVAGLAMLRPAKAQQGRSEDPLDALIEQNEDASVADSFDHASRKIAAPKASLPTLSPSTAETTEKAVSQYSAIVARGGWPTIPQGELRIGKKAAAIAPLRERLAIAGDLDINSGDPQIFDSYVEAAVRRFQTRHGLTPDGVVKGDTLRALNVPATVRLSQLKTNSARLRVLSGQLAHRHVVANIPAARIEAIEGGVAVMRNTAVAGKPDRPSPEISSRIVEINFNPFWTVPVSIVRKDLIPRMQAEPDYLTKNRIRIFNAQNQELTPAQLNWYSEEAVHYKFKQDPGALNSLGSMRINFPSSHGVYMHDTPSKGLFGEDFRFASSGCMRIQNVRELVTWLLAETPGWSRPEIDAVIRSGERKDARIAKPVPLYWVYVTAWATPDGVVQFRDDIYNRDGLGAQAGVVPG